MCCENSNEDVALGKPQWCTQLSVRFLNTNKSIVAGANYLALDRTDIQYTVKQLDVKYGHVTQIQQGQEQIY